MNIAYTVYYCRQTVTYHLESSDDWKQTFNTGSQMFAWLACHMGPGDTLHWVGDD